MRKASNPEPPHSPAPAPRDQTVPGTAQPIIDMHMHARNKMPRTASGEPMPRPCWPEPCEPVPALAQTDADVLRLTLEAMDIARHRELLHEVLVRNPNLRIYVENAGWPFLEEMTSLMYVHPNVYADLSAASWIIPRRTFYRHLHGLIEAGLGKRLMFGSDQMCWPEVIGLGIDAIESADFLTDGQKRDIFYTNAARFLRLSAEEIDRHHGHGS